MTQTESLAQAHRATVAYVAHLDANKTATEYGFQFPSTRQRENFIRVATISLPFVSWDRRGKLNLVFIVNN